MGITAKKQEKRTLLSHEETLDLIDKVQRTGDEQAKEILIENNLGLVRSVVSKFLNIGYDRDDLLKFINILKNMYIIKYKVLMNEMKKEDYMEQILDNISSIITSSIS